MKSHNCVVPIEPSLITRPGERTVRQSRLGGLGRVRYFAPETKGAVSWARRWQARPWPRRSGTTTWSSRARTATPDLIYIDLHLVHEVTSPQAFDGLRDGRPPGAPPRPDDRDRRPQHPDARHRQADRRPHQPHPDRDAARQLPPSSACACTRSATSSRASCTSSARSSASPCRASRSSAATSHTSHPRRVRRDGVRHRHERGRARARHPDPAAASRSRRWRSPSRASCAPA